MTTKLPDKLPPANQDFFDDNRIRFNAETSVLDKKVLDTKCPHNAVCRISSQEVRCELCGMGWIDNGKFVLNNGKIESINQ